MPYTPRSFEADRAAVSRWLIELAAAGWNVVGSEANALNRLAVAARDWAEFSTQHPTEAENFLTSRVVADSLLGSNGSRT